MLSSFCTHFNARVSPQGKKISGFTHLNFRSMLENSEKVCDTNGKAHSTGESLSNKCLKGMPSIVCVCARCNRAMNRNGKSDIRFVAWFYLFSQCIHRHRLGPYANMAVSQCVRIRLTMFMHRKCRVNNVLCKPDNHKQK